MPQQHSSSGRVRPGGGSQTQVQYQQPREQQQQPRRRPREEDYDHEEEQQQHYGEPRSSAVTATYMDLVRSQQALQLKAVEAEHAHKEQKAQLEEKERELAEAQAKLEQLTKQCEDNAKAKTALDETLAALQSENREGRSTVTQLTHVVEMAKAEAARKEAERSVARAAMDADLEREVAELQAKSEELCRQLGIEPEDGRLVARRHGLAVIVCDEATTEQENERAKALFEELQALKEALAKLGAEAGAAMDEAEDEDRGGADAELDQTLTDQKAALARLQQTELEKRAALAGVSVEEQRKRDEAAAKAQAQADAMTMVHAALDHQDQQPPPSGPPQQQQQLLQQQKEGDGAAAAKGKGKRKKGGKRRKQPTQQQAPPPPPPPVDEEGMPE